MAITKMWSIDHETFPKKGDIENQIKFILRYAILAPSIYNTQPWKFKINKNKITILPDPSRTLNIIDKSRRRFWISMGALLENFKIASRKFGFEPTVKIKNDKIEVSLKKSKKIKNILFDQITKRVVNKRTSKRAIIPNKHIHILQKLKFKSATNALLIEKKEDLLKILKLVKLGNKRFYSNKKAINEMLQWTRFNKSKVKKYNDGITYKSMDIPQVPSGLGKIILSFFLKPSLMDKEMDVKIKNSSGIIIITSKNDVQKDWIKSGQTLEKVLLILTSLNIGYDFITQICASKPLRGKLKKITKDYPQAMLRIGQSKKISHTPRREIKEFIKINK